jgi:hypothetical protein
MFEDEGKDFYSQLYRAAKFTTDELRQYPVCQNHSEEELERLSNLLFDLGVVAQKIIIECND